MVSNGTSLIAGTANGIFFSTDNGSSWISKSTGLASLYIYDLAVSGSTLIAGTGYGVYISTNNGNTWVEKNQGFTNVPIAYSVAASNGYVFAGTDGQYVFRRTVSEIISIIKISNSIPYLYTLEQNYPNPFNSMTSIKYEIPEGGLVKLSVYDMLGREAAMLVNEQQGAGSYRVSFDASGLNSGVYFYRLSAGNFTTSKKLTVIK